MDTLIGLVLVIAGIVLGIWLGIFVMLIGGAIQAIHGFQVNPFSAYDIVYGAVRVFLSGFVGWISFFVISGMGVAILKG